MKIQLTLFDVTYKSFFGRTWSGPSKSIKRSQGKASLSYNENTYFHTPLHDNNILIIVEVVAISHDDKKKSCGWTAFRPFASNSSGTEQRYDNF